MLNPRSPKWVQENAWGLLFSGLGVIGLVIHNGRLDPLTVMMFTLAFIIIYTSNHN